MMLNNAKLDRALHPIIAMFMDLLLTTLNKPKQ